MRITCPPPAAPLPGLSNTADNPKDVQCEARAKATITYNTSDYSGSWKDGALAQCNANIESISIFANLYLNGNQIDESRLEDGDRNDYEAFDGPKNGICPGGCAGRWDLYAQSSFELYAPAYWDNLPGDCSYGDSTREIICQDEGHANIP